MESGGFSIVSEDWVGSDITLSLPHQFSRCLQYVGRVSLNREIAEGGNLDYQ